MFQQVRHFIKWKLNLTGPISQTTAAETNLLQKYAKDKKCIVEIGVFHGATTQKFREVMDPNGELFAIDPFFSGRMGFSLPKLVAHVEAEKINRGHLIWCEELSHEMVKDWNKGVDFVFIDGDLSYEGVKTDFTDWKPHLISGGIIAIHASRPRPHEKEFDAWPGSAQFTQTVAINDPEVEKIDEIETITILQKK